VTGSGYTPAPYLGCYSAAPLEEFTATSHCQIRRSALHDMDFDRANVTVTAYDRTVTGEVQEWPATVLVNVTTTWREYEETLSKVVLIGPGASVTTSSTSREEMRTAMYYQSMVLLATMPSEEESVSETATSSAETSGAEETGFSESSATRLGGSAAKIGTIMAVWMGAMALGGAALVWI